MRKLGFLAFLAVSSAAMADPFDFMGGAGGAIPDGTGANAPGADLVVTLNVSGTNAIIDSLDLAGFVGLHTWLGDLVVTVEHLGVTVDLMDRNYRTTTGGSGLGSDLNGMYMFDEGATLMSGTVVPAGTYGRHANADFGVSGATGTYADFAGLALDGDWVFTFSDHWVADEGGIEAVRIVGTATVVPEPATLAVLGFGALAAMRRRRK